MIQICIKNNEIPVYRIEQIDIWRWEYNDKAYMYVYIKRG